MNRIVVEMEGSDDDDRPPQWRPNLYEAIALRSIARHETFDVNAFTDIDAPVFTSGRYAGVTPLMVAVSFHNVAACQALLGADADPNAVDADGFDALLFAVVGVTRKGKDLGVVDALIRGGADATRRVESLQVDNMFDVARACERHDLVEAMQVPE